MEIFIKDNGKTVKPTEKVSSAIPKAPSTKVIGTKTNSTVRVPNYGTLIKSNMKVISKKARRLEKENSHSMEVFTKEISSTESSMEQVNTISLTQARYMRDNS